MIWVKIVSKCSPVMFPICLFRFLIWKTGIWCGTTKAEVALEQIGVKQWISLLLWIVPPSCPVSFWGKEGKLGNLFTVQVCHWQFYPRFSPLAWAGKCAPPPPAHGSSMQAFTDFSPFSSLLPPILAAWVELIHPDMMIFVGCSLSGILPHPITLQGMDKICYPPPPPLLPPQTHYSHCHSPGLFLGGGGVDFLNCSGTFSYIDSNLNNNQ